MWPIRLRSIPGKGLMVRVANYEVAGFLIPIYRKLEVGQ